MQNLPDSFGLTAPAGGVAYVRGTDVPLSESTIGEFLSATAQRFPDRQPWYSASRACVGPGRNLPTKSTICRRPLIFGIAKGDRVGIWSPNRVEWLLTQFATARIGAVLVNINPAYRLSELEYALNKVGCKAIIAAERFKTSMYLRCCATWRQNLPRSAGELHARLPDLRT